MTLILSENFRALFYAPFYAAHALGAYEKAGVDVELRTSPDPISTGRALRAGEIDVMWGGPLRVLLTAQEDPSAGLVCFCNVVERDPFFLVGRAPRPDFVLSDLASVSLAVVSEVPTPWLCLQHDLRLAGIDPAAINVVTGRCMADNAAALQRGAVDAVQVFQPFAEDLIAGGTAHIWYAAATRGLTAYTTLVTRRDLLETRKDELQSLVYAMTASLHWFAETPAVEIAALLAGHFPNVAPSRFTAAIERYRSLDLWARTPVLSRIGFDWLEHAMLAGGALRAPIGFDVCVDNTLAEIAADKFAQGQAALKAF